MPPEAAEPSERPWEQADSTAGRTYTRGAVGAGVAGLDLFPKIKLGRFRDTTKTTLIQELRNQAAHSMGPDELRVELQRMIARVDSLQRQKLEVQAVEGLLHKERGLKRMAEETVAALSYAHQHEETQLTEEITLLREQLQLMQDSTHLLQTELQTKEEELQGATQRAAISQQAHAALQGRLASTTAVLTKQLHDSEAERLSAQEAAAAQVTELQYRLSLAQAHEGGSCGRSLSSQLHNDSNNAAATQMPSQAPVPQLYTGPGIDWTAMDHNTSSCPGNATSSAAAPPLRPLQPSPRQALHQCRQPTTPAWGEPAGIDWTAMDHSTSSCPGNATSSAAAPPLGPLQPSPPQRAAQAQGPGQGRLHFRIPSWHGLPHNPTGRLTKQVARRHQLWSRWEEGIVMDAQSWSTVTPEDIALDHAGNLQGDRVVDAMAGCGGNVVAFARHPRCREVVAIDVDGDRLDACLHNAAVYGVADKVQTMRGDFFSIAAGLQADAIFCSPPWVAEGSDWDSRAPYGAEDLQPTGLADLVMAAFKGLRTVTDAQGLARQQGKLGIFMPKNTSNRSLSQCRQHLMAHLPQPPVHFSWGNSLLDDSVQASMKGRTAYLIFA